MTHMDFLGIALDIMDGNSHDLSELLIELFKNRQRSRTHGLLIVDESNDYQTHEYASINDFFGSLNRAHDTPDAQERFVGRAYYNAIAVDFDLYPGHYDVVSGTTKPFYVVTIDFI